MQDADATGIDVTLNQHFYASWALTDREIARAISEKEEPVTTTGRQLAIAIRNTAAAHADVPGPCSFEAWNGEIAGTRLSVVVEEPESNTRLCGPACFNEIFVHQGAVLGVPDV